MQEPDEPTWWIADREEAEAKAKAQRIHYVIQCVDMPGVNLAGGHAPPIGQYLKRYVPDAYDGRGLAEWTVDAAEAVTFATYEEAMACWERVPATRPVRDDGMPNRPLTAYTVAVLERRQASSE